MTEKINGQGFRPADTAGTRRSEAAKPASSQGHARARGADTSTAGDTVKITQSGMLLSKLEELVQRAPVVDAERVATFKEAIASGSYEIDDRQVADRLLKFERDFLG